MLQSLHGPPSSSADTAARSITDGVNNVSEFHTPCSVLVSKERDTSHDHSSRSVRSNTSVLSSSSLSKRRKFNGDWTENAQNVLSTESKDTIAISEQYNGEFLSDVNTLNMMFTVTGTQWTNSTTH